MENIHASYPIQKAAVLIILIARPWSLVLRPDYLKARAVYNQFYTAKQKAIFE